MSLSPCLGLSFALSLCCPLSLSIYLSLLVFLSLSLSIYLSIYLSWSFSLSFCLGLSRTWLYLLLESAQSQLLSQQLLLGSPPLVLVIKEKELVNPVYVTGLSGLMQVRKKKVYTLVCCNTCTLMMKPPTFRIPIFITFLDAYMYIYTCTCTLDLQCITTLQLKETSLKITYTHVHVCIHSV